MAARVRFYLDENLHRAIAKQLRKRGIDVVTVRDLGLLGESDINHLAEATAQGRVLCTNDADYVEIAMTGVVHAGIVLGQQHKHGVGTWVQFLKLIYTVYESEEMMNRVEYVLA